jgi:hypothetical protein
VNGLDYAIFKKIFPICAIVTGLVTLLSYIFFGASFACGIVYGGLFGVVNTWLIWLLVRSVLDPSRQNYIIAALVFFTKIPIVYGVLILSFYLKLVNLVGFAVGLQLFLVTLLVYAVILNAKRIPAGQRGDDAV